MKRTSHSIRTLVTLIAPMAMFLANASLAQDREERRIQPRQSRQPTFRDADAVPQRQPEQDLFGDAQPGRQAIDRSPTDQSKDSITVTVWVLTTGDAPETPEDEVSVDLADRVNNLPARFESVDQVRELVGQLKVAGMLRKAREFRIATLDGQPVQIETTSNHPRVTATNIAQWPRGRTNPPRPFGSEGQTPTTEAQPKNVADREDLMVTNAINFERIGTTINLLPSIEPNGFLHVQFSYDASDVEKVPGVTLSEIPGRKPLLAEMVVSQKMATTVRLKSGTAVVVQTDSAQRLDSETPTHNTQVLIFAASVAPALE